MATISNNLEEVNGQKRGLSIDAKTLLTRLGFTISGESDIALTVTIPAGWVEENQGSFHTVFRGPNGEEVWSFIKYDSWDRHSFLHARGIEEGTK